MLNKVTLIGNLGKDIEVRTLDNGTKVGTFSLATTESYKDKSGPMAKVTEWHNIVIWKPSDSICKLVKGNLVYLEGKIKSRKYNDKEGIERTAYEIVSEIIKILERRESQSNSTVQTGQTISEIYHKADALVPGDDNDDLPFDYGP